MFGLYASSATPIHDFQNSDQYKLTFRRLDDLFRSSIRTGASKFLSEFQESERDSVEMKIALLVEKLAVPEQSVEELTDKAWVYISQKHSREEKSVEVQVRQLARDTPEIKSLDWIHKRHAAEEAIPPGVEECIIASGNELYEGLSSNFYVVKDGTVYLAPEGTILAGSIMKIVLDVCTELQIPLTRQCPSLEEVYNWQACFITSTSRLVLPVHKISWQEDSQTKVAEFSSNSLVENIRNSVKQRVCDMSESI